MPSVLIIDDEPPFRANLRRVLLLEGYQVAEADDGAAAIDMLRHTRPDLVLCDLTMPGADGYAVLDFLRADPRTASLPLIILTANAETDSAEKCRTRGANAFLNKPFRVTELLHAIEGLLDWRRTGCAATFTAP